MGYSYSSVLNKNNRKNKTGKHSIFIRVTVDRESKYFNLGERVEEKYWSGKDNRWIKDSHPFAFELNSIIKKKLEILHKYEYRQKLFGNGISLQGISEFFYKKADANIFNEFVDEYMRKTLRGKALNTIKKYRTFVSYDLCALTWSSLQRTPAGYCIIGNRFKNESDYIAPVHKFPNAIEIIEAQRGKHPELVFPDLIR